MSATDCGNPGSSSSGASAIFDGFGFHRLLDIPRQSLEDQAPDRTPAELFAALAAARAEFNDHPGAALAVVWHRPPGSQQINILVGGRPRVPFARDRGQPAGTRGYPLLYPPGAVAEPAPVPDLAGFTSWARCRGQADPLWTPAEDRPKVMRGGFDDHVSHMRDSFVWMVLAEPLSDEALEKERMALTANIPRLRQRENSELDRVALERAQARYRELSRARPSGMWNIHVLVGSPDAPTTRRAAALLCSSADLDEHPYTLIPGPPGGELAQTWHTAVASHGEPASPFPASTELLAALARPPRKELPGVRHVERADFDVTPESAGNIVLGSVLDEADQPISALGITTDTLNRHAFVTGATGSGKSQTVRHLLESLHDTDVPWLVIEPAKAEYANMAGRLADRAEVTVIRPGAPDDTPVGLNPLEPEPGFPLQTHLDLVRALFLASFEATDPFPQVLSQALTRCYQEMGWNLALGTRQGVPRAPRYPGLADVQKAALEVVDNIGYGKEVADNVRGFIDVRLGSLRMGTPGWFFEAHHPIDMSSLLDRNVVLEIEDIGNDQDKAFFIGAVLIRIYEHLRVHRTDTTGSGGLRHVTVIEEAHRLLKNVPPGSPAAHAVELFASLLAEIRAYGEGIVVAEQIPSKILPDVVKNTALKIVHRLPAADDREAVGATMNLTPQQSRHIVALPPGRAAAFADGMDRPLRIAVPLGLARESTTQATRAIPTLPNPHSALEHLERDRPHALREISLGRDLAEDPGLTLWIELLTIAHTCGLPSPRPHASWLEELRSRADGRIVACAIAARINAAVDDRLAGLSAFYPPENLLEHLTASAMRVLAGGSACPRGEVQWQAGTWRWADVYRALKAAGTSSEGPHPDTAAWTTRGLRLAGHTVAEQLEAWKAHPDTWRPSEATVRGRSMAWRQACDALHSARDPQERLKKAASFLQAPWWPLKSFVRAVTTTDGGKP
ncbi:MULTISPECIES: ATP-binding protein [Streptomyces]|uniref:ATP-binding protein n=1 Tax=Streptomyces griseocarneus TaxID=51201 RepID=A0ABX7RVR8_9ACTN|nr:MULTISPECIES: ATP-binding protein [Streptomyces]QSY51892.1 ATP-binding protein [Streptomyces griseocarneus]